jgi:hypothetical protein
LFGCNLDALGIRLIDGEGQPSVFKTIRAFHDAGLKCAAFLDNEDTHSGCRAEMKAKCGLFVWTGVKNIEEAIATTLPFERWSDLILAAAGNNNRAKSYEDQMRSGLPAPQPGERPSIPELVDMHGEATVRKALSTAMQDGEWLKSKAIGYTVGRKLLQWGLQDNIAAAVRAFAKHLPIPNDEPGTNAQAATV